MCLSTLFVVYVYKTVVCAQNKKSVKICGILLKKKIAELR